MMSEFAGPGSWSSMSSSISSGISMAILVVVVVVLVVVSSTARIVLSDISAIYRVRLRVI